MPELPEVETTCRGLAPIVVGQRIRKAVVREHDLRQRVPRHLARIVAGLTVRGLTRRGKYLLFDCGAGTLIVHLGMSGRLWVVSDGARPSKHDHFDLTLESGATVRLRDPRRFGLVLWHTGAPLAHDLLKNIGPEPLSPVFDGACLHRATRGRTAAIKLVLMDGRVVAGIGNIYANEALFRACIHPRTPAGRVSLERCEKLVRAIRETLQLAIGAGGSSLRDYVAADGQAGYFQNQFLVYGRGGEPCVRCGAKVREIRQGQRSTCYCPHCQKR